MSDPYEIFRSADRPIVKILSARLTPFPSGCYSQRVPFGRGFDLYDRWVMFIRQGGLNINLDSHQLFASQPASSIAS